MIEANLKELVELVKEVTNSHLSKPSDEAMMSNNWGFIFNDFDGWVVLKVSSYGKGGYWMHPSLYPAAKIDEAFKGNLHEFSISPIPAGYDHVISGDDHRIEPFWGEEGTFNSSEVPLFFNRFYHGHPKGKENYIEFNQLVTHPLGLHWSPSKTSYCSVNRMGEEVEKIKLINTDVVELVLIRRRTLDKLLHLGKWVLVRYFDFNRWLGESPPILESKTKVVEPRNFKDVSKFVPAETVKLNTPSSEEFKSQIQ